VEQKGGKYLSPPLRIVIRSKRIQRSTCLSMASTAYGVAVGKKFDIDPSSRRNVDGKLYFNLNPMILEKWSADTNGYIHKSEENWPQILEKAPSEL
jgi:hypothetical protein